MPATTPPPQETKPSPTAATGKPPVAAKAPAKPATKPKKKRRGCLPILILLLLIAAVAFAIYRYPQEIERLSGWKPPALDLVFELGGDQPATKAEKPKTELIKEQLAALTTRLQQAEAKLETLQTAAMDSVAEQISRLEREQTQLSRQVATALSRDRDSGKEQTETDIRLIDLSLRLTGDTAAAAADLRRIATTGADASFRPLLLEEAARVDATPTRALLLRTLRTLQQKAAPEQHAAVAVGEEGWIGQIAGILNFRHETTPIADAPIPLAAELKELEILLLTQQGGEYYRQLEALLAAVAGSGDDKTRQTLETLKQYGEPDYRLRLP